MSVEVVSARATKFKMGFTIQRQKRGSFWYTQASHRVATKISRILRS